MLAEGGTTHRLLRKTAMDSQCQSGGRLAVLVGVHPVAVVVDPVEDQAVAMGGPNEGIPIEWRPLACEVT